MSAPDPVFDGQKFELSITGEAEVIRGTNPKEED